MLLGGVPYFKMWVFGPLLTHIYSSKNQKLFFFFKMAKTKCKVSRTFLNNSKCIIRSAVWRPEPGSSRPRPLVLCNPDMTNVCPQCKCQHARNEDSSQSVPSRFPSEVRLCIRECHQSGHVIPSGSGPLLTCTLTRPTFSSFSFDQRRAAYSSFTPIQTRTSF